VHAETTFIVLFGVATAVAVLCRWLKVPYTAGLVVAGLLLGSVQVLAPIHLTKELLFAVVLPGLIFEAAFHLPADRFWSDKLTIVSLAVPGVVAAILLTAAVIYPVANGLHFIDGFGFVYALVFAAVIAATDPIAVVGLFKSLGAPKRLSVLVEGESLLNDGTGVVLFTLVLAIAQGQPFTWSGAVLEFVKAVGMGALVGGAFGYLGSKITARLDEPMVEITLTVIAAYGSFVVAEQLHFSGVIATVVAGLLFGNYGATHGMSATTRVAVESFWEYLAFALNSLVFLLIGLEVSLPALLASWPAILVAYAAVLVSRAVVVFGMSRLLGFTREKMPRGWPTVVTWSGLRGALSMVLVLGLPRDLPFRELLVNMTFGVVVLSILGQGLTMPLLMRRLGIVSGRSRQHSAYEKCRGAVRLAAAALAELGRMREERTVHADVLSGLESDYQRRLAEAEKGLSQLQAETTFIRADEEIEARRRLLATEKDALLQLAHRGLVGHDALDGLLLEVNQRLREAEAPPRTEAPSTDQAAPPGVPRPG